MLVAGGGGGGASAPLPGVAHYGSVYKRGVEDGNGEVYIYWN